MKYILVINITYVHYTKTSQILSIWTECLYDILWKLTLLTQRGGIKTIFRILFFQSLYLLKLISFSPSPQISSNIILFREI